MQGKFSIESFLEEGLILQTQDKIFVSSAPFETQSAPHSSKICFYTPDFFCRKEQFTAGCAVWAFEPEELISYLSRREEPHCSPLWTPPSFQYFQKIFDSFQTNKELVKAVPVFFSKSSWRLSPSKRAFLLNNILKQKMGFVYGFWNKNSGILGATPEYLFEKKGKYIRTMALAGTGLLSDSLMKDLKELREHQIVVDDLCRQWNSCHIKKSAVYEQKFGSLKHLQTDIQFQSDMSFTSIVQKMHPTPALGGSPKETAWQWLLQHNGAVNRRRFGAPFAVHFPNGDGFVLTAIRNIQWDQDFVLLGSGCGLTAKSKLEKEWIELRLKRDWAERRLWS